MMTDERQHAVKNGIIIVDFCNRFAKKIKDSDIGIGASASLARLESHRDKISSY